VQSLRDEAQAKSLGIALLPASADDRKNALTLKATKASTKQHAMQNLKAERFKVRTSSIFSTPNTSTNGSIAKSTALKHTSRGESKVAIGLVSNIKR
jgi:hypothetical protein